MSWVGTALLVGGTAASVGGNMLTQNSNVKTAQNQANAANAVLQGNIAQQEQYSAQNEGTFNNNLATYTPDAQSTQLADAQTTRGNADVANITPETGTVLSPSTAPAEDTQDLANRMGAVMDYSTENAKNQGALEGYGDTWLTNSLNNAAANRQMGVVNSESQLEANLLPEEQQIAETGAWSPPSPWGSLLSGVGSIAASAGGAQLGSALKAPTATPSFTPTYGPGGSNPLGAGPY